VLGDYVRHYNEARPHRGRQLSTPLPRRDQPRTGEISRSDILAGIIHEYDRAA
jgi:putative transposase